MNTQNQIPLCVDLDGTLIYSDTMFEGLLLLARHHPLLLLCLPFWLLRGKAYMKRRISDYVQLVPTALPYNQPLISWITAQRASGRELILITGASAASASTIAGHLGIFSQTYSSDDHVNLTSKNKRDKLINLFGERGFDYAGDSSADLAVWAAARSAIVVDISATLEKRIDKGTPITQRFAGAEGSEKNRLAIVSKAIRVRQWAKNLLIFLPLLTSHEITHLDKLAAALLGFITLSFCASAFYIFNDLLDLESDRKHPTKRRRPFASGTLKISDGIGLIGLLLTATIVIGSLLPVPTWSLIILYAIGTSSYSMYFKRKPLPDVFALSGLYTLRVLIGGAATNILVSPWLLGFSVFFFLSLAFCKRSAELFRLREEQEEGAAGRGWYVWDMMTVCVAGLGCGIAATLVLGLYLQTDIVHKLYRSPAWLWLIVPLMLYWICRAWLLVQRGSMNEDPVLWATRDKITWLTLAICAAIGLLATLAPFGPPGVQP